MALCYVEGRNGFEKKEQSWARAFSPQRLHAKTSFPTHSIGILQVLRAPFSNAFYPDHSPNKRPLQMGWHYLSLPSAACREQEQIRIWVCDQSVMADRKSQTLVS